MKPLRRYRSSISAFLATLMAVWQIGQPLQAAVLYWDSDGSTAGNNIDGTNLGGTGTWNPAGAAVPTSNWWDLSNLTTWPNTNVDQAIFSGPGGPATPYAVTLADGITANKLSFLRSGYTLSDAVSGVGLTLAGATPTLQVNYAETATINSLIQGVDGLTKVGGGSIRLGNSGNTYTGTTTINEGTLVINHAGALGMDASAIVVNGSVTRGFVGGALLLEGGYTSGVNLTRTLSLQGQGPTVLGAALLSVGSNSVASLSNGPGTLNTIVNSASGRLSVGNLALAGTAGTTFMTFGVTNSAGAGSYAVTGAVSGPGGVSKSGAGTLIWSPSSVTGWSGIMQVSAGSIRVADTNTLGTSVATNQLDLNGGILEIRSDAPNFSTRRVNLNNGGTLDLLLDRAVGGSGLNQTVTFANFDYDVAETLTMNTRNGYGVSFATATAIGAGTDVTGVTNNGNGTATFGGTLWGNTDTSSRTLTLGGSGNITLSGNVTASGASHHLVKSGTGTLTINGTASTYTGNTTITGTLSIGSLGAINKASATGSIQLSTGTLTYTGATDSMAKPFSLIATTGSNAILSNGAGTLTLTGNVGAGGAGIKTFYLGGTNTGDNTISSLILDNNSTNITGVSKIGNGTWVMKEYAPAALGSAGSVTIAAPGTTSTNTITLSSGTTAGLLVGQVLAGTTASTPPQITSIIDSTHFTVGVNLTTTTAPAGTYTVNPIPTASTATNGGVWSGPLTIASGTLKLVATNAASNIVQNTNSIVFNVDALNANQTAGGTLELVGVSGSATTETLGALTPTAGAGTVKLTSGGSGAAANLIFTSLGTTTGASSVNFNTTSGGGGIVTLQGQSTTTATTLPGTSNFQGHLYINGANFAAIDSSANVITPTYGTTAGFVNAASALTATSHNLLTGSFTSGAATVSSLKATTQTLTLSGNLIVSLGAILQTGGTATIQSDSSTARTIVGSAAGVNIAIRVDGTSDVLNLGALNAPVNISSTTTAGLTKNGAGTLIINGVNAQTGATTINEGTVRLGVNTPRLSGASAALVIRQGAMLDLNGQSSGTAIGAFDGAGTVTNSSATPATLLLGGTGTGAGTFSGIIQDGTGVMNVSLNGTTGSPVWSGLNTYTGVTTIGTGLTTTAKLVSVPNLANIGTASSIGRGLATNDTTNAASLVFAGLATAGINYTGSTSISIDRLFTLNGGFAGAGGQIANSSANNSTLILNKTNAIAFGTGATVAQTLTLGGTSTGDNQINLQVVDNAALPTSINKTGAGVWILGNTSNSYTGTTTITAGCLQAVDGTSLPTASGLILGGTTTGGAFLSSGTFTRSLAVSTSAASNTISWNAGLTTGASGFAGSTDKLVVAIGGLATPTPLSWNVGGFMGTAGTTLLFNCVTALSEVEFRNAIDLNGANRIIQVDDNTNTFADFATITGVISNSGGTANLTKSGAGVLQLFGANSYNGATAVTGGTLVVNSLGNSSAAAAGTSVGTNQGANTQAQAITLGNAGTTGGILQYIGPGETSDRMIRLNTTTGSNQIHADGSGPLILTNVVNDMTAGAKTLFLRGSNAAGNMITSTLADNGGALGITADMGGTWVLSNANSYSGATDITAGAMGAGNDSSFGTGVLRVRNGSLFAYGGDRTLANPLADTSTTTAITSTFIGDYSINLTSPTWTHTNTTVGQTITNNIVSGKTLTIGGDLQWNSITAARTMTLNGTGDTIINGNVTTSTAFGVNVTYSGTGSLTLGGTATDWNTGLLTISSGTLKLGNNEVIPHGSATESGNVVISPILGATARFDLNGKTETINGLTANSAGDIIIDNTAASAGSLVFGSNNAAVVFGGGTGNYTITDSGAGALSITKTGSASMTIPTGATLTYQGTTNVTGGSMTIASPVTGTTGLSVSGTGSLLALTGGITTPSAITSVNVGGGSTLSLLDGAGSQLANLTALTLGSSGGTMTTLNLNVGDLLTAGDALQTDTLSLLTGGTLSLFSGNQITFNLTDAGLNANQTYTLISVVDGGLVLGNLGTGDYLLGGTPGGFTSITLNKSDTGISITTGNLITGASYWNAGGAADNWSDVANWSPDDPATTLVNEGKPGTAVAASVPGQGTDVVFIADNITGGTAIATTLEQNFKINSLTFEASTTPANTPVSVTINPGVVATNRLEIAPQLSTDGIRITAGGPPSVTIAAPLKVGTNQTWNVADAATTLTLSGALFGAADITKTGAGRVVLGAAADSSFNLALTSDVTVSAGTLELTNAGALGTAVDGTLANIAVNGGAFYYNNAVAGTIANPLALGGGTLSAGGATQIYSSNIPISANSTVNMRDSNSATLTTTQRNITLPGVLSGAGKLTVDSINTLTAGNQITGTLSLSNNNSGWSGGIDLLRGQITATNVNALGTGNITATAGKILFNTAGGTTFNLAQNITLDSAGALLELNADASGTPVSDMTVNFNGVVTLGSVANANMALRLFQATDNFSILNFSSVVLGNNASISVAGSTTRQAVIGGIISETGGARVLTINDDLGGWAQTNGILRLNGANSYTGGTILSSGTLVLGNASAISSGPLTVNASSTLQSVLDFTAGGVGAMANVLTLSGGPTLTISGTGAFTFSSTTTNSGGNGGITNSLTSPAALILNDLRLAEAVAPAARTVTIAGAGTTTINTLTNNDQSNTLTNNGTGAALTIGTVYLSESTTVARTLTLGGTGSTLVNGVIADAFGGAGLAGSLIKSGAGTLTLAGVNTFSGGITITAGKLQFSTVSNNGGPASNLGVGTDGISLAGTLEFIGGTNQATNRAITLTGTSTFTASGTAGATITYNGTLGTGAGAIAITLDGSANGILNSAFVQTGTTVDLTKNGTGTWDVNATNTIADDITHNAGVLNLNITQVITDDIVVTGNTAVLNLNAVNIHQGDDLFIRAGAVVNLGINGALGTTAPGMDDLVIADTASGDVPKLDLKGFTSTVDAVTIGLETTAAGQIVDTVGGGVLTATSYTVRLGDASAVLAGAAATLTKNGAGTFTLSGNNTFGGATTVTEGRLILDYTTSNGSKIASAAGLTLGGAAADANARLSVNGSATAPTTQAFTVLTLNNGANDFDVVSNGGQAANVNFTTITRTTGATVDFVLPSVGNITTTQPLTNGLIGGYATVNNATAFAGKDASNNIIAAATTVKDDVSTWVPADNVIDSVGFSGTTLECAPVNSVTFTQVNSTVNVGGTLGVNTGGLLISSSATGAKILGGQITTGSADLVVHQGATGDFQIGSGLRGVTGLTKTGTGGLLLSGVSTATGAVNITEGLVKISGGQAIGDTAPVNLKDAAGSGLILLANETVGSIAGGGLAGGNITLGANTLTINQASGLVFGGAVSGNGAIVKQGTANLNFDVASSPAFTGSMTINQGLVFLSGNGVVNMPAVTSITTNPGGAFLLDFNSGTTLSSRVNDLAAMNLASLGNGSFAGIQIRSSQDTSHSETVGALNLLGSSSIIAVSQGGGTARTLTLTAASIARSNNATVFFDGRNFAVATGDNRGRLFFTAAPAVVGGAGVAGNVTPATNVPIVRYAVTLQNPNAVAVTDVPNTFANYNSTTGVTPLNTATEYRLDGAGYGASADVLDNLRFTAGATGLGTKEFNAAVFDSSAGAMTIGGAGGGSNILTIGSGAMLFTSTVPANGTILNGFDRLTPGANSGNEWIITVANTTATINSVLNDGAAATTLTKSGSDTLILGADNLYTGGTVFNQGTIQADTLARFGTTGNFRFQGGTLRFTGVFDPSPRSMVFNLGGATLDTNGNDVPLANAIGGSGVGGLTKSGTGILTLNAAATYTGATTILDGTLRYGVANALTAASAITVNGVAATLDVGAFTSTTGGITLTNGVITGTGSLSPASIAAQAGSIASTLIVAGATGLTKSGAGTLTIGGSHTYTGTTWIQDGTVSIDSIANRNGTASAIGAPATAAAGTIKLGNSTTSGTLNYTGGGHSSNRDFDLVGTTGGGVIDADGTGALVLSGAVSSEEFGAKTLVLRGSSAPALVNQIGAISECFGVLTLNKLDSNTWQVSGASTYTGATNADNGTLKIGVANALPVTTALRLGTGATAATLDTNGFNQTVGTFAVSTNSTTLTDNLIIGAANTFTVNGPVTIGANAAASTTLFAASGGGSFVNTNIGGTFQVGGATGSTNTNATTADFSGLAGFTADLGSAGTFRVGDNSSVLTAVGSSQVTLATNSTITAGTIMIASQQTNVLQQLHLGSGTNTLNANTLQISGNTRGIGLVDFSTSTGTVTLRAADGTSRAAVTMGTGTTTTGNNLAATLDLTNHGSNLLISTLIMAERSNSSGSGSVTATLSFNEGTLDVTTMTMASRTNAGTGGATATVNFGDSAAAGIPTVNIGALAMGINTGSGSAVTADFNITGGNVAIGAGSGTAINMANAGTGRTVTSTLDLTGGSVSVTGNIIRTGGAGTENATVTLGGAALNMNGNTIGSATAITFVAESGSLSGLGQLNNGGLLTKTTTGTLTLGNGNQYSGGTQVSAGVLVAMNTAGSATGSGAVTVAAPGTLGGTGVVAGNVNLTGTVAPGALDGGGASLAGQLTVSSLTVTSGTLLLQLGGATVQDPANVQAYQNDPGSFVVPASWTNYQAGTTAHDQLFLSAAGGPNLDTLTVQVAPTFLNSFSPSFGDVFQVLDWASLGTANATGSVTFNLPSLPSFGWDTSLMMSHGLLVAVPEPSRMLLLFFGLVGIWFRRRR